MPVITRPAESKTVSSIVPMDEGRRNQRELTRLKTAARVTTIAIRASTFRLY